MIFAPGFRGGPRALTLSFLASAVSNSATVIVPGTAAVGDLAVLLDYAKANTFGNPGNDSPTGYTRAHESGLNVFGTNSRQIASYKLLTSGDPGNSITGMNSFHNNKVLLVFRPSKAIGSVTSSVWGESASQGDPGSITVSASGQTCPLIVLAQAACDGATAAFSTASPAFDGTVAVANNNLIAGYKIYNQSASNHTIDMNDLGDFNQMAAGYLQVVAA